MAVDQVDDNIATLDAESVLFSPDICTTIVVDVQKQSQDTADDSNATSGEDDFPTQLASPATTNSSDTLISSDSSLDSLHNSEEQQGTAELFGNTLPSFKLVGDNIDKSVKPCHETRQSHSNLLHYFHCYAVKDRCDVKGLEDSSTPPREANITAVLPTDSDDSFIRNNMAILFARVVRKHFQVF